MTPFSNLSLRNTADYIGAPCGQAIDLAALKTATMENGPSSEGRDPSGFLSEIIGAPVTVKLNSGVVYKGENECPHAT